MRTDELIRTLQADSATRSMAFSVVAGLVLIASIIVAAIMFFAMLGPRPDMAEAMTSMRFPFKFVVTIALAISAAPLLLHMARPGQRWTAIVLFAAPVIVACAAALELVLLPPGELKAAWLGKNALLCMTFIPLIGIGPLLIFLAALRYAAPTRPVSAGAVAGLLAGGIAATFYAAHCTDDSPLFVITWYTLAVLGLALIGAFAGRSALRW